MVPYFRVNPDGVNIWGENELSLKQAELPQQGKNRPLHEKVNRTSGELSASDQRDTFYYFSSQMCLQRMNFKEERCQGYLQSLKDCCDMWGEESYKVCRGTFDKSKQTEEESGK